MSDDESSAENGVEGSRAARDRRAKRMTQIQAKFRKGMNGKTFTSEESNELITNHQADPGLTTDLANLTGDTTDDLGPIR